MPWALLVFLWELLLFREHEDFSGKVRNIIQKAPPNASKVLRVPRWEGQGGCLRTLGRTWDVLKDALGPLVNPLWPLRDSLG